VFIHNPGNDAHTTTTAFCSTVNHTKWWKKKPSRCDLQSNL